MNKADSLAGITFAQMQFNHLEQVLQIEKLSFPTPWTKNSFDYELRSNEFAHYIVALAGKLEVAGYAGMWVVLDEAHVTNIAVHQDYRGHGLGAPLMVQLMQRAIVLGVRRMTLEVRPTNAPARALYARLGFKDLGRRKNYYSDTNEDAIIMWKDDLGLNYDI